MMRNKRPHCSSGFSGTSSGGRVHFGRGHHGRATHFTQHGALGAVARSSFNTPIPSSFSARIANSYHAPSV